MAVVHVPIAMDAPLEDGNDDIRDTDRCLHLHLHFLDRHYNHHHEVVEIEIEVEEVEEVGVSIVEFEGGHCYVAAAVVHDAMQ